MLENPLSEASKNKPEPSASHQLKASMNDARLFRNLMASLSSIIEEADFTATLDGIKLRAMDPSHIAMIDFEWARASFDQYQCPSPTRLRLSLSNLLKLLKRSRSDERLEIVYDDASKKLQVTLRNNLVRKFITSTLEPSTDQLPVPKIPFTVRVKLTAASLRDIIDDASTIGDNVRLEVTTDKFVVSASESLNSAIIEIDKASDAVLDFDVKQPAQSTYNLNYLAEMVRAGSGVSEVVSIEFANSAPIKVDFEMINQGRLAYYLADRKEPE